MFVRSVERSLFLNTKKKKMSHDGEEVSKVIDPNVAILQAIQRGVGSSARHSGNGRWSSRGRILHGVCISVQGTGCNTTGD